MDKDINRIKVVLAEKGGGRETIECLVEGTSEPTSGWLNSWKEYSSDKCPTSLCSTRTVFARISQTDLTELINTPIEDDGQIIDIDTDGYKSVSDSDVKAFLQMSQGIANPLMVQSLEKTRRNEVLRYALTFGAGVRQLSRLTGVSFGVVQKLTK